MKPREWWISKDGGHISWCELPSDSVHVVEYSALYDRDILMWKLVNALKVARSALCSDADEANERYYAYDLVVEVLAEFNKFKEENK